MTKITEINQLDMTKRYTYADYLTWQFSEVIELIKGKIYRMSPAPLATQQKIARNIFRPFDRFLEGEKCEVFFAPFDVRLPKQKTDDEAHTFTVVQPDICVICDTQKIDKRGCVGAPDLIIEILSQSTARLDYDEKFHLYEQSGVREYWIVSPKAKEISVYFLGKDSLYELVDHYEMGDLIPVNIFPDLVVDSNKVFDLPDWG